ncbi:hypothetical protein N7448_009801 [Penicillium atrosanguineum]|uniref:Uncharacterized protein n=1 Tax=Penicillium atrosanguineum TaxID=1132637 RepID=A0A9W9PZ23_9EURO|nr:Vesicle transport v-SNARE protein vti1 [Penicillium atrosanguineum]KAJ5123704.1 hypothetical protein N7448_009801 [Penicillium atrosanguineum]KAJ5298932.1 Vesicle transport v-SNARE protein vti1 [Penicillium atrosanguineum]KAJ5320806.1 hypothetical protein N7476_003808 [Penicillium atrosanguineum]
MQRQLQSQKSMADNIDRGQRPSCSGLRYHIRVSAIAHLILSRRLGSRAEDCHRARLTQYKAVLSVSRLLCGLA